MIDCHTHSTFSLDGKENLEAMMTEARRKGLEYLATTEHCDMDYYRRGIDVPMLDVDAYLEEHSRLKRALFNGTIYYAAGVELGYDPYAVDDYRAILDKYDFDVVINSVHLVDGDDVYYESYYNGRRKEDYYGDYFRTVRESLDVPYGYDVVGHIGYAMRYAPDKELDEESTGLVRDIFKRIIELDKTIELNSHVKLTGLGSVPTRKMLSIYRELGGENITFSSDAHLSARLADRYEEVSSAAKELGYKYYAIFKNRKREMIKID